MAVTMTTLTPDAGGGGVCGFIAATTTLTGTGASADQISVCGFPRITVMVDNGATNAPTYTIEGTVDGTNWQTLATRKDGSATYSITGRSPVGGAKEYVHLDPTCVVRKVRVNQSAANANGTTYTFYCFKDY